MNRFQDYFKYNGQKYRTGTVIELSGGQRAVFVCYNKLTQNYIYQFPCGGQKYILSEKMFYNSIVNVLDEVDPLIICPTTRAKRDSEIKGMVDGWILYIVAMMISTIFKYQIGWWLLWSYIFFDWRKNKIKKAGVHIDW